MLQININRHAGGSWEDWSDYVLPLPDLGTESSGSAYTGMAGLTLTNPPATPLKDWGLQVLDSLAVSDDNPDGVVFAGLIDGVTHLPVPGGDQVEQITASDYNVLLDYDVVPHVWRSALETDKERLTWLFETFGTHGITCGTEVQEVIGSMPGGADGKPEQEFGPSGLRDAAAKILAISGGKLRVGFDLALHHFVTEATASPFNLSDEPNGTTTREYFDFSLEDDSVPKVDVVVVFGAQQAEGAGLLTVTRTASDAPAAAYRRIVPLVDDKLTSVAQCEAAGDAYLAANQGRRTGKLKTIHAGLLGGQVVQITNAGTGLSAVPFAIASVVMTPDTDRTGVYDVTFGDEPPSQAAIIGGSGGLIERLAAAAAQSTDASRQLVDLSVGGANLIANSSFGAAIGASWASGTQWVFGYGPVLPDLAYWGQKTARADLSAQTAGDLVTAAIPVLRLADYWASFWTFCRSHTSGTGWLELREYDAGGALLASTVVATITGAELDWTRHALHLGPNDEMGRTAFDADTASVRLAIYTDSATLSLDVGAVQLERGNVATAYAPLPSELADGSIDASTKLIAYSIVAGLVAAGTLTADKFAATLAWVSTLIAGTPGAARIELSPAGLSLYSSANVLLVNFPTLTANAYFSGDVQATSLTLLGVGEIRGAMSLAKDAVFTAQANIQPPNVAPTLSQGLPPPLALAATAGWSAVGHGYYDAAGGSTGTIPCFVGVEWHPTAGYRVTEWALSDGSVSRTTSLTGVSSQLFAGVTRIGSNWYVLATGSFGDFTLNVAPRATGIVASSLLLSSYLSGGSEEIGTDGTYLYVLGMDGSGLPVAVMCSTAMAYELTLYLPCSADAGFTVADDGDGNGPCFWLDDGATINQSSLAGALVSGHSWPSAAPNCDRGLMWDGANFREAAGSSIYTFSNWEPGYPYWVTSAWLDDVGTTHETVVGPRASIVMLRRRYLTVTTAPIPGVGGADDPHKVRIYMAPGATDPGPTHYKLQATDALTSRSLATYDSGGAADGAGTAFPSGTGAEMRSAVEGWRFRGNGTRQGAASFPTGVVGGDIVTRSDHGGEDYMYDGVHWLCAAHGLLITDRHTIPGVLPNGSFETGTLIMWTVANSGSGNVIDVLSNGAADGTYLGRIYCLVGANFPELSQVVEARPFEVLTLSYESMNSAGGSYNYCYFEWQNAAHGVISTDTRDYVVGGVGSMGRVRIQSTAPDHAAYCRVAVCNKAYGTNMFIDDFSVSRS